MESLFLPTVRGQIGDWVYYSSVMPIKEVASRVSYVKNVHSSEVLSDLLQRSIKDKRKVEISDYLSKTDARFFNSLVLAVYGSNPEWYPASIASSETGSVDVNGDVGLLKFSGEEEIIPIDGQHRLAGIKTLFARYENNEISPKEEFPFTDDMIPVIFIAHRKESEAFRLRTRRLFTTLNKYAVKVNRYEIISLDEDDPMAITTRWLVENDSRFFEGRIKFKGGANISLEDGCLTSIENLYDVITILFTKVYKIGTVKQLTTGKRPSDTLIKEYREYALQFFECLAENYQEIEKYYSDENFEKYATRQREKGHLLFRPVGLKLFVNLISKFEDKDIAERFSQIKGVPYNLYDKPYYGLLMSEQGRMQDGNEAKVRNLIFHALGCPVNRNEIKSAKSGLSILTGQPVGKITNNMLPDSLDRLRQIKRVI
ncbi:DGQHR domain-containing protein [Desulforhopalus sp. 52FAK]